MRFLFFCGFSFPSRFGDDGAMRAVHMLCFGSMQENRFRVGDRGGKGGGGELEPGARVYLGAPRWRAS